MEKNNTFKKKETQTYEHIKFHPGGEENKSISNTKIKIVRGLDFRNSIFNNCDGAGIKFINCDFSYTNLYKVYFRNSIFEGCQFTGSFFEMCNFRGAKFLKCDFRFSSFKETIISSENVLNTLPIETNIKRELLQNHKVNAESLGDIDARNKYIKEEILVKKEHLKKARELKEAYYYNKYKNKKFNVYIDSLLLGINNFVWGYGEYPSKLVRFSCLGIIFFTLIFFLNDPELCIFNSTKSTLKLLLEDFKLTLGLFLDITIDKPHKLSMLLQSFIAIFRYTVFGLFVNILFRKFSKR